MGFLVLQAMKALAATENGQDVQAALETLLGGNGGSNLNERCRYMPRKRGQHHHRRHILLAWTTEKRERKKERTGNFFELDVKLLLQEQARRLQLISKIRLTNSYHKLLRLG